MNIGQAIEILEQGGRVRRQVWAQAAATARTDYTYVELVNIGPGYLPMLLSSTTSGQKGSFVATHSDLLAKDWETV